MVISIFLETPGFFSSNLIVPGVFSLCSWEFRAGMISMESKGRIPVWEILDLTGTSLHHLRLRVKTIIWEKVTARQIDFLLKIFFTKALLADRRANSYGMRCSVNKNLQHSNQNITFRALKNMKCCLFA